MESVSPAEQLIGKKLITETRTWILEELSPKDDTVNALTTGRYSVCYRARDLDGTLGFVKILNTYKLIEDFRSDPRQMSRAMRVFEYELEMGNICREYGLDRILSTIDDGQYQDLDDEGNITALPFLVFDLASGDARSHPASLTGRVSWNARVLHCTAVGIRQLHETEGVHIAHNDVKASNVIVFGDSDAKLGDLGRVRRSGHDKEKLPFSKSESYTGTREYAPPDVAANASPNSEKAFIAIDLYQFGSLICFIFSGIHWNVYLIRHLSQEHIPIGWNRLEKRGISGNDAYRDALTFIRDAFSKALIDLEKDLLEKYNSLISQRILKMVKELCEPDREKRGHPDNKFPATREPFSLEQYISTLDEIAIRQEIIENNQARIT